ncbi:MAG TPA: hypothetical protein VIQ00_14200 [Chitinophagaceae bacterium]
MRRKNNTTKTVTRTKTIEPKKTTLNELRAVDKVSHEMAAYFEAHVTASNLVRWITTVSQTKRLSPCGEIDDFISNIGWSFLPKLINCKDAKSRSEFLESSLINVFAPCGSVGSKTALCEIGRNYLSEFEALSNDPDEVDGFMKIYSAFLSLMVLYSDYKFLSNEEDQESRKAA